MVSSSDNDYYDSGTDNNYLSRGSNEEISDDTENSALCGRWSKLEDDLLKEAVTVVGARNWKV